MTAVEKDGASYEAGLREGNNNLPYLHFEQQCSNVEKIYLLLTGDVILSINGQNMARVEHKSLVSFIRKSPTSLKMVVVSDERARKVELHMRYVHLQKKLQDKMKELDELNFKEKMITMGVYRHSPNGLSDFYISSDSAPAAENTVLGRIGASSTTTATEGISSVCCFCPQRLTSNIRQSSDLMTVPDLSTSCNNTQQPKLVKQPSQTSQTQTVEIVRISSEKKPRSKSVKIFDKETGLSYYDSYRKCQSSRELSTSAASRSRNNSITDKIDSSSKAISSNFPTNKSGNSSSNNNTNSSSKNNTERDSFGIGVKPKSWDNVMLGSSTRSFGGYGFGFGYGYFPTKDASDSRSCGKGLNSSHHYSHHVTHPHHHNHHSHCTHAAHSQGNYYYGVNSKKSIYPQSQSQDSQQRRPSIGEAAQIKRNNIGSSNKSKHLQDKYDSIVNPYQYHGTITSTSTSIGIEATSVPLNEEEQSTRSKTLPSLSKKTSADRTEHTEIFNPTKMERTLSDSSLNSENRKEPAKGTNYFKRSGDNVRFSSDEDFYSSNRYGRRSTTPNEREHIFV